MGKQNNSHLMLDGTFFYLKLKIHVIVQKTDMAMNNNDLLSVIMPMPYHHTTTICL